MPTEQIAVLSMCFYAGILLGFWLDHKLENRLSDFWDRVFGRSEQGRG